MKEMIPVALNIRFNQTIDGVEGITFETPYYKEIIPYGWLTNEYLAFRGDIFKRALENWRERQEVLTRIPIIDNDATYTLNNKIYKLLCKELQGVIDAFQDSKRVKTYDLYIPLAITYNEDKTCKTVEFDENPDSACLVKRGYNKKNNYHLAA